MDIPYTHTIPEVRERIYFLVAKAFMGEAFSLTGDNQGVLACHNSLITTILTRIQYEKEDLITKGIDWIYKY